MINIDIEKELYGTDGIMKLGVKFQIKKGDFVALVGNSGAGKTTLLRILCGLDNSNGTIVVDDKIWQNGKINLKPQQRKIGFVFQDYALFENMNVEQNLLYIKKDIKLANRLLEITQLSGLKKRMPKTLSGGQKQRVSLCRAIMNEPQLLLLDEPLSALDDNTRTKLQNEIYKLHKEFKTTTIMVSHDKNEIYKLSNKIITLHQGKIQKEENTQDLIIKTNANRECILDANIVDINKEGKNHTATILTEQRLIKIPIAKNDNLKANQKINIDSKIMI